MNLDINQLKNKFQEKNVTQKLTEKIKQKFEKKIKKIKSDKNKFKTIKFSNFKDVKNSKK